MRFCFSAALLFHYLVSFGCLGAGEALPEPDGGGEAEPEVAGAAALPHLLAAGMNLAGATLGSPILLVADFL